jgi:hypothetical protein
VQTANSRQFTIPLPHKKSKADAMVNSDFVNPYGSTIVYTDSGDCGGSRIRTRDSCVLCLVSPSCFNQLSHHIPQQISFCLPSENFVQILPESGSALDLDPYPHSFKMLVPDQHTINADPKNLADLSLDLNYS